MAAKSPAPGRVLPKPAMHRLTSHPPNRTATSITVEALFNTSSTA
jgi:hypothetical protein